MRVITGTARGRRLETLSGEDVRPTADRVKEAIFSILQFDIEGRHFLDLFAGSGQMGIEALSRGAAGAVFVDAADPSVQIVRKTCRPADLPTGPRSSGRTMPLILPGQRSDLTSPFWIRPTGPACCPTHWRKRRPVCSPTGSSSVNTPWSGRGKPPCCPKRREVLLSSGFTGTAKSP